MLLYVNDIILTSDDHETINNLKHTLMKHFKMTYLRDAKYYEGVEIDRTSDGIFFHQRGYIQKLLDRFGMSKCSANNISMNSKTKLRKKTFTQPVDKKTYQSLVGGLLHATISRWNIQFAVGCVSTYLTNPQMEHLIAAKNIL